MFTVISVQFSSVIFRVAYVINITTRTTIVSNVQFDDNIRIGLLEEEGLSRRRKLENVDAETTSSGSPFQIQSHVEVTASARVHLVHLMNGEQQQVAADP